MSCQARLRGLECRVLGPALVGSLQVCFGFRASDFGFCSGIARCPFGEAQGKLGATLTPSLSRKRARERESRATVVSANGRGRVGSGSCGFGLGEIPSAVGVEVRGSALAGVMDFAPAESVGSEARFAAV